MSLRIGIDVSGALNPSSGIGRYTVQLAHALHADPSAKELVGWTNSRSGVPVERLPFTVHRSRWPDRVLKGAWRTVNWPPVEHFVGSVDVFHGSDWVHPPQRFGASVTTVHDLGALAHPEWYDPGVVRVHRARNEAAARTCDRIIAISEYTRACFSEHFPMARDRVVVVPNGVGAAFRPVEPEESGRRLTALGIARPYVLYVGTREPRKNLLGLIRIFRVVSEEIPDVRLVVAGARPWAEARTLHGVDAWQGREVEEEVRRLGLGDRVAILGRVDEADLRALYSAAECFTFPSLLEGFGLPVLEAMACGCPVVASDRTAVPEVVGEAGLTADPEDIDGFADAVREILRDGDLAQRLRSAGRARADRFSWRASAAATLAVYREAASEAPADRRRSS